MTTENFGRYEIRGQLGKGGMATVHLAYDPQFKRNVALKVLPEVFLHDDTFRQRFQREAEVIGRLEHKAIVPVYDFGEHRNQPYLVMRYMSGGSLADRFENRQVLNSHQILKIVQRIASALDEAHRNGIIHRDLKPGNILFDQYGDAYLADFGIAKLGEATTTITGTTIVGTPAYMSPEQVHGRKGIDGRSDIYTLGIILYELLTGQVPYKAETPVQQMMAHVLEPVPDLRPISEGSLPPECSSVIQKALAKEPNHRHNTAGELAKDLSAALQIQLEALDAVDVAAVPLKTDRSSESGTRLVGDISTSEFLAQSVAPTEVTPSDEVYQATNADNRHGNTQFAAGQNTAVAQKHATAELPPAPPSKSRLPTWAIALIAVMATVIIAGISLIVFVPPEPTISAEVFAYETDFRTELSAELSPFLYVADDAIEITHNNDLTYPHIEYVTSFFPEEIMFDYMENARILMDEQQITHSNNMDGDGFGEALIEGFSNERTMEILVEPAGIEGFSRVVLDVSGPNGRPEEEEEEEEESTSSSSDDYARFEEEFLPNINTPLRVFFFLPQDAEIIRMNMDDDRSPELYYEVYIPSLELAEMIRQEIRDRDSQLPPPITNNISEISEDIIYPLPNGRQIVIEIRGEADEDESKVRYYIEEK